LRVRLPSLVLTTMGLYSRTRVVKVFPMKYLDMSTVKARRNKQPPHVRSSTGYGSKLPTATQLRIGSHWHRVYLVCWSNSGTHYVIKGRERLYIVTGEL
jgi:hypothetical protein